MRHTNKEIRLLFAKNHRYNTFYVILFYILRLHADPGAPIQLQVGVLAAVMAGKVHHWKTKSRISTGLGIVCCLGKGIWGCMRVGLLREYFIVLHTGVNGF